ncbi:MAG: B12-binding domain-containing radical SAM protein [Fibrobacterota bacterium]
MNILLINPWIHDFKCYDEWMRPLGLFRIQERLNKAGMKSELINFLGTHKKNKKFGTGDFFSEVIKAPELYSGFQRNFKKYGFTNEKAEEELSKVNEPDLIFISSGMTFWYNGLKETIDFLRKRFKKSRIILGGTYASLMPCHAQKFSGADEVVTNNEFENYIVRLTGKTDKSDFGGVPRIINGAAAIRISAGCPSGCTYCASKILSGPYRRLSMERTASVLLKAAQKGKLKDIVFYDDALLFNFREHLLKLLEIISKGLSGCGIKLRYHCPNGLHAGAIDPFTADKLKEHGFETLRIGYEYSDSLLSEKTGGKVTHEKAIECLNNLSAAGFRQGQPGVNIMLSCGLKKTIPDPVKINELKKAGARIKPILFSPVPGTDEFKKVSKILPQITKNPLYHNDAFFSFKTGIFSMEEYSEIKKDFMKPAN